MAWGAAFLFGIFRVLPLDCASAFGGALARGEAGFADFETDTVRHTFVLPSFDAYYGSFERGGASTGQALAALPEGIRRAVREEVRRDLADTGGPVKAEAEYRIASGRR